ncbi:mannose-6-phosphate isomerase, class I [Streptomyces sp. NPDC052610]|uniref:mannose-6-phosphate isomerase, class I n=1 Tax=Streptomyces sp. NPDC052610 TaxID=3154952 RepID=UPI00343C683C
MDLLQPIIKPYAWGSRHALARLQGRAAPSAGPEAELWMGAHPSGPSGLVRSGHATTLRDVVAADPERELGADCARRFGGRLPFLLKVLAADQPLSIQVHPDRERARTAFAAQLRAGARGPYADDWAKPELLCALTPFEVLAGLRPPREAADVLAGLGLTALRPLVDLLRDSDGDGDGVGDGRGDGGASGEALRTVLEWPPGRREALVGSVVDACRRRSSTDGPFAGAYDAVVRMARHHPGDPGLVAALLMRHQVLEPGTALFMPAGGLHAYVSGLGVEVLANSDNVLRAGLTAKEVDVPELLRVTDPAVRVPVVHPRTVAGPGLTEAYDCPAEEFALPGGGPRVALCVAGSVRLRAADGTAVRLGRGASCFLSAADEHVRVEGSGTLFVAAPGVTADADSAAARAALSRPAPASPTPPTKDTKDDNVVHMG